MKHCVILVLATVFVGSFIFCGRQESESDPRGVGSVTEEVSKVDDILARSQGFVNMLADGDYTELVKNFDSKMKEVMPAAKAEEAWNSLLVQVGAYKRQIGVRQTMEQGFDCVYVTCEFAKAYIDIKIVYNSKRQISGLWFVPSQYPQ